MSRSAYRHHDENAPTRCKCGGAFAETAIETTTLLRCTPCDACFVSLEHIRKLIAPGRSSRAILARMPPSAPSTDAAHGRQHCPICGEKLQPRARYLGTPFDVQVCSEHGVYFEGGDLWRVLADRHERLSALDRSTTRASQKRVFGIPSGVVPAVVVIVVLQLLAMLKNC